MMIIHENMLNMFIKNVTSKGMLDGTNVKNKLNNIILYFLFHFLHSFIPPPVQHLFANNDFTTKFKQK